MARSIRGWIRNLADGLGPPPGSVAVSATVMDADGNQDPLNATDHALGNYTPVHAELSGDPAYADALGHWGWDMEFSPGPITQTIVPDDPQVEYRKRFPDESAPIGKAYHSDLERLAWTGGRDACVWNAIPGGHDPSVANWSSDPLLSAQQGNLSIAAFGADMSFTLRRGIAFVGGTVFSIEMADLGFPYAGVNAAPANATAQDRWDLVCLKVVTDPTAYNYGKQQVEVITGTPGGGIPSHPGQPTLPTGRRLVLHALKVPANSSAYNQAFDLRRWLWLPQPAMPLISVETRTLQVLAANGAHASTLNTQLAASELKLPMGVGFTGTLTMQLDPAPSVFNTIVLAWVGMQIQVASALQGYDVRGQLVAENVGSADAPYIVGPHNDVDTPTESTIVYPIPFIPSYHNDSGVSPTSRTWHRLRPVITYTVSGINVIILPSLVSQRAVVHLWPVP